jgi:8-oxo-dGTP diphosphatase
MRFEWIKPASIDPEAPMPAIIGTDVIGIFVTFVCHDGDGRFLLSKRSAQTRDEQGTWDFGGGTVEFGERVTETLHRELREEYGVEPVTPRLLGYRDCLRTLDAGAVDDEGDHVVVPTHWIGFDFLVRVDPFAVRSGEPDKIDALDWFDLDKLPSPLHSGVRPILRAYTEAIHRELASQVPPGLLPTYPTRYKD